MEEYRKSGHRFIRDTGELRGDKISGQPDADQSRYLDDESFQYDKKRYRIRSEYILREIAGEYAIIPVDTDGPMENAMMAPNDSAVFIWKCFEESSTVEEVVQKGLLEYDVTEEVLRSAVEQFVKESLEYKILEEAE